MGVSRQCAHRWIVRFDAEGETGLCDRSSRPRRMPTRTAPEIEQLVLAARREHRRGQDWLGPELGVPARTVSRILRRHGVPRLAVCDPMTGELIRASKTTAVSYERDRPGELTHMDVKKIGRIPDGGGWRARGRQAANQNGSKDRRVGYDYIHSVVDDHSRFAYSEILGDEQAPTTAAFFARALDRFAEHGIHIDAVMTDNAWNYTHSNAFKDLLDRSGTKHVLIRPHCPWQNGKVERYNRTLQTEWAYRQVFTSNADRTAALAPWLEDYNTRRRHSALGGLPPISRLSRT
jgi:transposase InsO family protein